MYFSKQSIAFVAILLIVTLMSCRSSSTTADVQLIDVPGTAILEPVEALKMPAELLDAANAILARSDHQLAIDGLLESGSLAERRAVNYLMFALYQDISLDVISVWTPVCDAGLYRAVIDDLADANGAEIDLDIEWDDEYDMYVFMWDSAKTRQYLADLGDKLLTENQDTVWYVELSVLGSVTSQ